MLIGEFYIILKFTYFNFHIKMIIYILKERNKWKHYQPELILLTVRWYLRYNLSFRNLVEMMEERGVSIAHTTIMR